MDHEQAIVMFREFYEENSEFPMKNGLKENESILEKWVSDRRRDKKRRRNANLCARIEQEISFWKWDAVTEAVEKSIAAMQAFYDTHGELPKKNGLRANEAVLSKWLVDRRRDKLRDRNFYMCARLEHEFPFWRANLSVV